MSDTKKASNGVGVIGLLGVVFVTLKLTGHIDWSWLYVTAPFWGGIALVLVTIVSLFIIKASLIGLYAVIDYADKLKAAK